MISLQLPPLPREEGTESSRIFRLEAGVSYSISYTNILQVHTQLRACERGSLCQMQVLTLHLLVLPETVTKKLIFISENGAILMLML